MEQLRLAALDVGLLGTGEAILAGLGLVRDVRAALRYAGLSLVIGWAATSVCVSLAVEAGLELRVVTVVVLWGLLVGASLVVGLQMPGRSSGLLAEHSWTGRVITLAGGGLLVAVLVALFRRVDASGPLHPDAWGFWLPRAKVLFETGNLDTALGGYTSFAHPEYPPLLPSSEAVAFGFMGQADVLLLPVQHWALFVGFLGAVYGLLCGRVRPAVLLPSLAAVAMLPSLDRLVGSSLADEPLAELFSLAGIAAVLWLLERDGRLAVVCGILLVALPMTKNEGLMLGVALLLMLGAATTLRAWRTLVPLVAVTLLAAVPWRLWHAVNDVRDQSDYRFGDIAHFGRLAERIDRLGIALRIFSGYVVDPGRWLLAVPLLLVLAFLLSRQRIGLAVLSAGTVLIAFAGYLVIYWIGLPEIRFYLDTSGERVAAPLAVFSAALFPLLATEAWATMGSKTLWRFSPDRSGRSGFRHATADRRPESSSGAAPRRP
jgi:hypothetical protein